MKSTKFIAYYRVSTARQGQSGLGLEAQQASVNSYVTATGSELVTEFVEVESGKKSNRVQLEEALRLCRKHNAVLLIAKLDRLARNVRFIAELMESSVEFLALDMMHANKLTLHIMAAVAEDEAARISARTKAALQQSKARGVELGKNGKKLAAQYKQEAQVRAEEVIVHIDEAKKMGAKTYAEIAARLNDIGLETPKGAKWHPAGVMRVIKRIEQKAA